MTFYVHFGELPGVPLKMSACFGYAAKISKFRPNDFKLGM